MIHLSNISEAASALQISSNEAAALIPALRIEWEAAAKSHDDAMDTALRLRTPESFAASRLTSKKRTAAQKALNAAQWAAGERWSLRVLS